MSFLPEQRFGSQWPRSQQAALKEGREEEGESPVASGSRLVLRGGPRWMCFPREEKLSFLWRTMASAMYSVVWDRRGLGTRAGELDIGGVAALSKVLMGFGQEKSYGFVTLELIDGLIAGQLELSGSGCAVCVHCSASGSQAITYPVIEASGGELTTPTGYLSYHLTVAVYSLYDLREGAYLFLLVWKIATRLTFVQ